MNERISPATSTDALDALCINTLRFLSIDAVQKANSGHPGLPMGAAPMAYVLWTRFLQHNPANPNWFNRDRFILSAGHGSMLLYSLLHVTGYAVSMDDINRITLSAGTDITFTEDCARRFAAYGWHTVTVDDGNDIVAIDGALRAAQSETKRPSLILVRTHIGYGSPHKQDSFEAHGSPLGVEEVKLTKEKLGWPTEPAFLIPDAALAHFRQALDRGAEHESGWKEVFAAYAKTYPDL